MSPGGVVQNRSLQSMSQNQSTLLLVKTIDYYQGFHGIISDYQIFVGLLDYIELSEPKIPMT